MRNFDEFIEKTARTRVQKMVDAGKITDTKTLDKIFFERKEIKDNINNKINAKAKRAAGAAKKLGQDVSRAKLSDVTSKQMTASRYKRLSKTDSLKSVPAIDTNRQLKDMGKENAKIIKKVRSAPSVFPDGIRTLYPSLATEYGEPGTTARLGSRGARGFEVELPGKKWIGNNGRMPKQIARERRGGAAAHEIQGELKDRMAQRVAFVRHGLQFKDTTDTLTEIGSHISPRVLVDEAATAKRLSPAFQKYRERQRQRAKTFIVPSKKEAAILEKIPLNKDKLIDKYRDMIHRRSVATGGTSESDLMNRLIDPNMPKNRRSLPYQRNLKDTSKKAVERMNIDMMYAKRPYFRGALGSKSKDLLERHVRTMSTGVRK